MDNCVSTLHKRIHSPSMATMEARLKSFESWPMSKKQKPHDLAECGFFYLGSEDKVMCFYCGIGIHDWLCEDNVWLEHAINSYKCPYLLLNKSKASPNTDIEESFKTMMVKLYTSVIACFCKIKNDSIYYFFKFIRPRNQLM